ncbi:MAG TPA: hypothetical protein VM243_11920 [Phycisphaerae bacterium]|nr:hypothetical protein [Phycisphaerae bacterium]
MLPQFYRFVLANNSGQTITFNNDGRINVKQTCWIIDPATGKITYTQLADDDLGFIAGSSIVNGAELIGDVEINNTANLYLGAQIQLEVTHDEGAAIVAGNGGFTLFLSGGDATGELPTDATGYGSAAAAGLDPVGTMPCDPNVVDDEVMRSNVWEW